MRSILFLTLVCFFTALPGVAQTVLKVGRALPTADQESRAIEYFDNGNRCRPRDFACRVAYYSKAIETYASFAEAFNNRGSAYFIKGDTAAAVADFNKAVELDKNFVQAFYNRAVLYTRLKDYPKAVKDFETVVRLEPKLAYAYAGLGNVQQEQGNYRDAIANYSTSIVLAPGYATGHYNRALAHS
ncbi:MAG: tetratricopeptide repeat protein, partial [Acidobacteria bacterium]|nr:tetratricopeptide repeat protein [Acidobacteriota bacterium]MCA1608661.1 tetratricopeptide repeat protein [Acidobacteriota bacterium]